MTGTRSVRIFRYMSNRLYENTTTNTQAAEDESRLGQAVLKWWPAALLGLTAIGAYGLALYAFSIFIEPIKAETGWSNGALSGAYSLGLLVAGLSAVLAGRILDWVGHRPVMLGSLVIGSGLLWAASSAHSLTVFVLTWGMGAGVIGAGLHYNLTMAVTARLFNEDRARAFAVLTFIGGLASPIYFPLTGFMIEEWGWRITLRILVALLYVCVLPAAFLIRGDRTRANIDKGSEGESGFSSLKEAFGEPRVRRMLAAFSLMLGATAAIQVHHVPAMQAAGLSLSAAAIMASIRGILSLPGRAMLSPIVNLAGVRGAILIVYAAMVLGLLALMAAGPFVFVAGFAVITGLAFGTILPLHGLYAAQIFGAQRIGTLMGAQTTIVGLFAALGPVIMGQTIDITGGYTLLLAACAALTGLAMLTLSRKDKVKV